LKGISGVTVDEFLALLKGFQRLTIPSQSKSVDSEDFKSALEYMYDHKLSDDGILFEK